MNLSRVPKAFTDKFPDMSESKAQKHYDTYLSLLRHVLLKRMPFLTSNYTFISLDRLWTKEFQYKNKRYYVWNEFKDLRPFFVVLEDKKGNGRKKLTNQQQGLQYTLNSEVFIMNQKLIDFLIDTADVNELVSMFYGELTPELIDTVEVVPVDISSLTGFIENTQNELARAKYNNNPKHEATLYRNLRQAKYVKIISEFFFTAYNDYVLPQIPNPSPYGRVYYKGINIQNISKEVRAAALGDHVAYDLNAAVYAIKLMMAKRVLNDQGISDIGKYTYTKEYLDSKSQIREKLANHLVAYRTAGGDSVKLVKDAITAIGFGARIGGGSWKIDGEWHTTSIEDIIFNKNDRMNFMNDPWVKQFVKEQHQMTNEITKAFIESEGFVESVMDVPNMFKNGKIRKSQVMSYLFQHTEKQIMDVITENIPVIARVHDSFITKKKLSVDQTLELKSKLNHIDNLMTIDFEEFHAWIPTNDDQDESDIDEAFAKLTGVSHAKPVVKFTKNYAPKTVEGFYDGGCDYGKQYYDPENDSYVESMNVEERERHYKLMGYTPSQFPQYINNLL